MYRYKDYFATEERDRGYGSAEEERRDLLQFLDLLLENYLEAKKNFESEPSISFAKGLKLSEEEAQRFFFLPPRLRARTGYDPAFAEEAEVALSHIESRVAHSDGVFLPFQALRKQFSLDDYEMLSLLLALAVEVDLKYTRLFGYIANESTLQYATTGVLDALYASFRAEEEPGKAQRVSDPEGDMQRFLFYWKHSTEKIRPMLHMPLVLHPTIRSFLLEKPGAEIGRPKTGDPFYIFREDEEIPVFFEAALEELDAHADDTGFVYIESLDPEDVFHVLHRYSEQRKKKLYILETKRLFEQMNYFQYSSMFQILQGLFISLRLSGAVFCVRDEDAGEGMRQSTKERRQLERELLLELLSELLPGRRIFLCGEKRMPKELLEGKMPPMAMELEPLDGEQRFQVWKFFLGGQISEEGDATLRDLADCHETSYGRIRHIAEQMHKKMPFAGNALPREELLRLLFRFNAADLGEYATRLTSTFTWEDIEMQEEQRKVLLDACSRYRLRGRLGAKIGARRSGAYGNGVSILLCGPPGTGKTMVAQVIAGELGIELFRVDISQIFSKYVGETQKNLGAIFERAAATNVILFFDEADALFSKRTDVSNSNDRHANAQTAFLLQKIEAYRGMTLLATNLYRNFDTAFVRRITYVVRMENPDAATRQKIWEHVLPEGIGFAPDVDIPFLAEHFDLSGSSIKNILHSAAYMSAANGSDITAANIVRAMRYEYEKLGIIVESSTFGKYGMYVWG